MARPQASEVGAPPELPAHVRLMQMAQGLMLAKAVQAVAELGIADLVASEPRSATELAAATGMNPDALYRLLRGLAAQGLFSEDEQGKFTNTPLSEALRDDVPMSARDYVIYAPNDGNARAWMQLKNVLKTGEPSFASANGADVWTYLSRNPGLEERFNRAMVLFGAADDALAIGAYDFGQFRTILDVGGGQGRFLANVLRAYPGVEGTLFELPAAAAAAQESLRRAGFADRTHVVAGDMFETIPGGYAGYVIKNVLHGFSDEAALAVLKRCRGAVGPEAKLVIVEAVVVPGNEPHPLKMFDLHMLVTLGGRERTAAEFQSLLGQAGFEMTAAQPLPGLVGIIEAVPA